MESTSQGVGSRFPVANAHSVGSIEKSIPDPVPSATASLEDLVEEFSAQVERGEQPDADAFIANHPEHADRLRRILPTMLVLANLSSDGDPLRILDATGDPSSATGESRTLGDYRIIREIGRGGMGIVYEAEQISLGRRVALKILPFACVLDPRHLQRFKNEAFAAAHLDHPNIVEVYGVGCERGDSLLRHATTSKAKPSPM